MNKRQVLHPGTGIERKTSVQLFVYAIISSQAIKCNCICKQAEDIFLMQFSLIVEHPVIFSHAYFIGVKKYML